MNKEKERVWSLNDQREDIFNSKEAAEYLSITLPTLYKYVQNDWIAYYKPARKLYFKRSDLDEFLLNEKCYHRSIARIEEECDLDEFVNNILQ